MCLVQQTNLGEAEMIEKKTKRNQSQGSFGALFPNENKRHHLAPQLVGHVELDKELFEFLIELYDKDKALCLQIAAWKKPSDTNGSPYFSVKLTRPFQSKRAYQYDDRDEFFDDFE